MKLEELKKLAADAHVAAEAAWVAYNDAYTTLILSDAHADNPFHPAFAATDANWTYVDAVYTAFAAVKVCEAYTKKLEELRIKN